MRKAINSIDLEVSELGELTVTSSLVGVSKPDILLWTSGSDTYAQPNSGVITGKRRKALFYNNGCAAVVSIADENGSEKPFLLPAYFTREIVFPFEIEASAVIKAKNLETGRDFDLAAEFA